MATVYSDAYWTGTYTYTRVKVDYSGTTATATLLYTRTNTYSGATGAGSPAYFYFGKSNSYGTATISGVTFYGQQTDAVVGSCTFTISQAGGTYSGYSYNGGYVGGDTSWSSPAWSVTIPSQYTKPAKPTVSTSVSSDTQINVTYGTTSWGNPNSGTVYLYGGTSTAPTTQIASKTTTGNSTYSHTGLSANTMYYYRARANNGQLNSDYSTEVSAVTKAPKTTLSLNSATSNSLVINYSAPADGGKYAKTLQYSIDSGSTWTTGATISSGSATTGNFTISGLNANTQYTIQSRIVTTAGTTTNTSITASTIGPTTPTLTVANNSSNYSIQTATYGTTNFGGGREPIVCLYGGASDNPITLLDSKSTTGTSTFNNTGLTGNKIYYYRAKAGAIFGSGKNYFVVPTGTSGRVSDNALTVTKTSAGTGTTSFTAIALDLAPNTQYTLSYNKTITGDVLNRTGEVRLRKDGTWTSTWDSTGTLTFTTGPTGEMAFGFYNYYNDNVGGTNTVAWSNIQVEKGSSKTAFVGHNVDYVMSDYSPTVSLVTRLPRPTIQSGAVIQYETASTVKVRLSVRVPADDGYYNTKDIFYRYSTDGGSTWSSWTSGATVNVNTQIDVNVDIPGLAVDTSYRFQIVTRTPSQSNSSNGHTFDLRTSGQHQPPTNFDYEIYDANSGLVNWLSGFSGYSAPVFVQGQSTIRARVPEATKGTCSDGATLTKYVFELPVDSFSAWVAPSSYPMVLPFGYNRPTNRTTDYPSNMVAIKVSAYDSLNTYREVDKTALSLSWERPTVAVSGERLPAIGTARIDYSGTYARLQDASLNSGNDLNDITVQYRILDAEGEVLKTWTTVSAPTKTNNPNKPFLKNFTGRITITDIPASSDCKVEVRITDHFVSVTDSYVLIVWDNAQINEPVHCDIELWDWKTNTFIADLSYLVVGELNITWQLNDVEEVSFDMDLMEFEKKCQEMGLDSEDLLKPYAHDIRIRRNGEYILGCQLVDVNIQISNNPPSKISVKGTGFLNLLKDQYILNEAWSGYTYAQIARKLVQAAQLPDCLVKNPTGDIDTSYWLSGHGTIAYSNSAHSGDGCISCSRSGTGWVSGGTQMDVDTGQTIRVDMWIKGQSGITCYVRERRYVTESSTQGTIATVTLNGSWQHIQVNSYTTAFENSYILVECNRTNSTNLLIDDCYVYAVNDDAALCNLNIPLGVDTASANQENSRQVNYELQNVKDALINLTNMEDDNFEFEFEPDRTFNVYGRKGADKLDLEVAYPGNVDSMTISRSASNVANKIIAMGSGIGDERLQTIMYNNTSRSSIGTRESVTTDSNISLEETLRSKAIGNLYDRKDPTNIPKIVIQDGSINPSNVETGDVVLVEVHGENFIESTTGEYRIVKIDYSLSENAVEKMTLTVERPIQRPAKKMIRYIRDSIAGNSENGSDHWVEVQALMLSGNEYINVARGKTVTCSFTPSGSGHTDPQIIVDGNTTTEQNYLNFTANNAVGAVTIDLGAEYPIDYIQVWHYYHDGRSYKQNTLSVGTSLVGGATGTGALSDVLWQYSGSAYVESAQGKRSKWLQEQNVVEG